MKVKIERNIASSTKAKKLKVDFSDLSCWYLKGEIVEVSAEEIKIWNRIEKETNKKLYTKIKEE